MKHKSLTATMVLLGIALAISVWGDSTTLTISNGSDTVTSSSSSTLDFPIARTGDTSYEAFLQFQTQDGTAIAGADYTAASGTQVFTAGASNATIPVTVAGSATNQPDKTFQMLLLGSGGAGMGFTPSFATHQNFVTGNSPASVTEADLNGDGKPDLIVANEGTNTVSVLLNTTAPGATTPSFATQQTFGTGSAPSSVTTADVNGDGKPDLIVANDGGATVSVLLNATAPGATTPSFASEQEFGVGNASISVAASDVNGDGRPDLIVANANDKTVSVLLNTTAPGASTPSFATQQTFAVGSSPFSVTAADINGDGKPDLIAANSTDATVSVLLNTTAPGATTPSFATQQTFAVGSSPFSVTTADINGDGKADLIVANFNSNTFSVLLNTTAPGAATPSFAAQQIFTTGGNPSSVTATDVNGDGRPDIIVAALNGNGVSVLLNATAPGAATPSFTPQQLFASGSGPFSVTVADVNGDGKPDLISANNSGNTVSVLLNTMPAPTKVLDSNSFGTSTSFGADTNPRSLAAVDLNGDGLRDLVVANSASATVSAFLNTTAPGATTPSFATKQDFTTGSGPVSVTAADLNGDGLPDLIVANFGSNNVGVLLNTTAPGATTFSFANQQTFAVGAGPFSVAVADVNGDGKPDLITANDQSLNKTVSVLLNTTAPGATTLSFDTQQTFTVGTNPAWVTSADVNGDGLPDLIVANVLDNTVSVLLNTTAPGATTPSFATQATFATGIEPASVIATDVNGDGLPDLIVANAASNTVSVLLNTTAPGATTASFATKQDFNAGNQPGSATTADINGDGKPDLIVLGEFSGVSVLLNTTAPGATTASFATQVTYSAFGFDPHMAVAADVNGDGKTDVIVAGTGSGFVFVMLNALYATTASGSPATGTIHYNISGATPTATATSTATATATATNTATATATNTATATATATPTATQTATATATSTGSATATPTATATATATRTATSTATATGTATATRTATATATATRTATATATATTTSTGTGLATPTPTITATPTITPTSSTTATPTVEATSSPATPTCTPGQGCPGGAVTISNNGTTAITTPQITVVFGNADVFSDAVMTATVGATTFTSAHVNPVTFGNSPEQANNTVFTFNPPVTIPPGGAATYTLTTTIATNLAMRNPPMMYASMIPRDESGGSGGLLAAMLLLSIGTAMVSRSRPRRLYFALVIAMLAMTSQVGCDNGSSGGSSGSAATVQTSTQKANQLKDQGNNNIPVSGLPKIISKISVPR